MEEELLCDINSEIQIEDFEEIAEDGEVEEVKELSDKEIGEIQEELSINGDFLKNFEDEDLFERNEAGVYEYEKTEVGKCARGSLESAEVPERNVYAQRVVGGEFREEDDEGGHLIGTRFKGSGELENLEAQNKNLNRSGYKIMENEWADVLKNDGKVYVNIETYHPAESERPDSFMGYSIMEDANGERRWDAFSFQNASIEEQDEWARIADEEWENKQRIKGDKNAVDM